MDNKEKLVYLAIPFSWNPNSSFEIVNKVASNLMLMGYSVFSPVSHSHPISLHMDEIYRNDWQLWRKQDLPILEKCDTMMVVVIDRNNSERGGSPYGGIGLIEMSEGCTEEIKFAREKNIPVQLIYETDMTIKPLDTGWFSFSEKL